MSALTEKVISHHAKLLVEKFLKFVNTTGSPYHSAEAVRVSLEAKGFVRLDENKAWPKLVPNGKYYVLRNHSAIMGFVVGGRFDPSKSGAVIIATHTDSPCLRVRPKSDISSEQYKLLGVECYGGGLWHTWFDRGLGLAGKVVVRTKGADCQESLKETLVRIPEPVVFLPNLAIHLTNSAERSSNTFTINTEQHLRPVICSYLKLEEAKLGECTADVSPFLSLIREKLNLDESQDIVDLDVCLMDATPSRICGMLGEFIESPRLDNLLSTWAAFHSLEESAALADLEDICVCIGFDHEEIGSTSWIGANSNILQTWLTNIADGCGATQKGSPGRLPPDLVNRSIVVSADMAHGVHPNYADKHQNQHKPLFHKGVVIKENQNQRYATHALTSALTRQVARESDPPAAVQDFVVRNDSPCGSTIGPMTSANLGIRTVDVGVPQWAMHSVRETCGVDDAVEYVRLFQNFFRFFRKVDSSTKMA